MLSTRCLIESGAGRELQRDRIAHRNTEKCAQHFRGETDRRNMRDHAFAIIGDKYQIISLQIDDFRILRFQLHGSMRAGLRKYHCERAMRAHGSDKCGSARRIQKNGDALSSFIDATTCCAHDLR